MNALHKIGRVVLVQVAAPIISTLIGLAVVSLLLLLISPLIALTL